MEIQNTYKIAKKLKGKYEKNWNLFNLKLT